MTKTRPTREGKGGIQDGILLEKKRILQKPDLLRGKGACWKGKAQTLRSSTRPCGGPQDGPGANFAHFGLPFGSRWLTFGTFFPPMSRKPADFSLPISLLQVAGVPGVRRCRSASTIDFYNDIYDHRDQPVKRLATLGCFQAVKFP